MQPSGSDHNYTLHPQEWVSRYADGLYGFVCSRVSDEEAAQDIVQETFLSAWKAKDTYNGGASEKNWLMAICKNKIIDHYRKSAKEVVKTFSSLGTADSYFEDGAGWSETAKPKDWGIDYNQTLESKEFYKMLEDCKKKLQELQQAVFTLKYVDDMKSDEICKELQITPSNYWVLLHRAKLQLRSCIERNWLNDK